jgi:hypothetical protein
MTLQLRVWLALVGAIAVASATTPAAAKTLRVDAQIKGGTELLDGGAYEVKGAVVGGGLRGGYHVKARQQGDAFAGSFVYRDGRGMFRGTSAGRFLSRDGTVWPYIDELKVTGGTGVYRRASGTLKLEGTVDVESGFQRERMTGSLDVRPAPTGSAPRRQRLRTYSAVVDGAIAGFENNTGLVIGDTTGLSGRPGITVITAPQGPTATVTLVYYDGLGSLRARVNIKRTTNEDGSITIERTGGGFVGGTGRYARVRGAGVTSFSAKRDTSGAVRFSFSGRLRY